MSRRGEQLPDRTHHTSAEVAAMLCVSERHIRNLCNAGEIPCVRIGRY